MAVTYGFYNALNHDRLYDAIQMSSIFDGIIRDGIFSTIGDTMIVTAPEDGMYVNVGSGRAWFNHTWTLNDTDYPIEAEEAEVVLDRIDAVILEVNSSTEVRANSIKFLKGTPSTNPVKPTLTHNAEVNQYALAYVRIKAGQTTIFQSDIENAVGTDETPLVTGVLQQVSIETLLKQWEAEFNTYFTNFKNTSTTEFNNWFAAKVSEYTAWFAQMQTDMDSNFDDFDAWFQRIKGQLSEDAAGHLQVQIDNLNSDLSGRIDALDNNLSGRIDDIADEKANNDILSDAWNASTTYAVGQYCIYNNSLWKCLVQHNGQAPTEGTYWTKVSVANEITSVNNSLSDLTTFKTTSINRTLDKNVDTKLYEYTATKNETILLSANFGIYGIANAFGQIYITLNGSKVMKGVANSHSTDLYNTCLTFMKNLIKNDVIAIYVLKNTGGNIALELCTNKDNQLS